VRRAHRIATLARAVRHPALTNPPKRRTLEPMMAVLTLSLLLGLLATSVLAGMGRLRSSAQLRPVRVRR